MKQEYPPQLISRLWDAVEVLACNPGSMAKRLSEICAKILDISPKQFPEALRKEFEELCIDLRTELSKTQGALKPFGIPASSNFEGGAYTHYTTARRLAEKIVVLCRSLAYELEVWANRSYSSHNQPDIKRLREARRRREKALKRNPVASQMTDGASYLDSSTDASTNTWEKEKRD